MMKPPLPKPIERDPPADSPSCFCGLTVGEAEKLPQDELDARLEALVRECREGANDGR